MKDSDSIDIFLNKLGEFWKTVPSWRFGQLVLNVMDLAGVDNLTKMFFMEDDTFYHSVKKFLNEEA